MTNEEIRLKTAPSTQIETNDYLEAAHRMRPGKSAAVIAPGSRLDSHWVIRHLDLIRHSSFGFQIRHSDFKFHIPDFQNLFHRRFPYLPRTPAWLHRIAIFGHAII
jgi:hypothetical protein